MDWGFLQIFNSNDHDYAMSFAQESATPQEKNEGERQPLASDGRNVSNAVNHGGPDVIIPTHEEVNGPTFEPIDVNFPKKPQRKATDHETVDKLMPQLHEEIEKLQGMANGNDFLAGLVYDIYKSVDPLKKSIALKAVQKIIDKYCP
ncbi:hypothetical protein QAD02_000690 [Eretmocerus hayati]|uniref:Uncharacterized protein n=1 Tax=Eretmocerus hayati TaxID=131215 RepID=A0ACC2NFJ2_9HYME|nr:hypothetical protein QAD02_000690 [Eretmocerus hayati]